ncbi:DUF6417 family protein [Streptomyces sp. UNOC14_S4]|uniref:DUF6417 family protein n=1 Tax=Streptomyces sp. UNOC14_S4 TaxID=2872340 RepID=UPI001E561DC6|nr:DUF6417 family protein [Streptomyces sp. UNOC14_S4]MCC3771182.1 hypothetical protein [Streptomyces sp. UNOC14_S4]
MGLSDSEYESLAALRDGQHQYEHGWATYTSRLTLRAVDRLRSMGLCELADFATRETLRPGPPQWAARLTPEGHDTLVYVPERRDTRPVPAANHPEGTREITLRPQAMDAVRLYLRLGPRLRQPPAPGLEAAVRAAQRADHGNIWHLHVTEAQAASIGYALWLETHAKTVRSAHYLAREHDVRYEPLRPGE